MNTSNEGVMDFAKNLLGDNVKILKSQVTKTAYQGVAIAISSIVIATLILSYYYTGEISLAGIVKAQSVISACGCWIPCRSYSAFGGNIRVRSLPIRPER